MSTETQTSTAPDSSAPHFECAEGCSPSHRRLRRTMTAIVIVLVVALAGLIAYLALTGGFSHG